MKSQNQETLLKIRIQMMIFKTKNPHRIKMLKNRKMKIKIMMRKKKKS